MKKYYEKSYSTKSIEVKETLFQIIFLIKNDNLERAFEIMIENQLHFDDLISLDSSEYIKKFKKTYCLRIQ